MKHWIVCKALGFLRNTRGAVAFEYVLIIGGVSAVVVVGIGSTPGLSGALITGVCSGMDALVGPPGTISC